MLYPYIVQLQSHYNEPGRDVTWTTINALVISSVWSMDINALVISSDKASNEKQDCDTVLVLL